MSLTTDSIFYSIRKLLGPSEDDPGFDSDIIDFINSDLDQQTSRLLGQNKHGEIILRTSH